MALVTCPQRGSDDPELVRMIQPRGRILRSSRCGHEGQRGREPERPKPTRPPTDDPPVVFDSDDAGYREWTRKNPFGFVINTTRPPSATYVMLHEASCYHMSVEDHTMHGQSWTGKQYTKVCSRSKHSLREWAQNTLGGKLDRCQDCAP